MAALQHTLTVVGLSAVFVLTVLYLRPDLAQEASRLLNPQPAVPQVQAPSLSELMDGPQVSSAVETESEPLSAEEKALLGSRKQQQFVTDWLSRRYRVADEATNMLVSTAYLTASEMKLDPLLILAVMAIESGLNPFAESAMGAQGLMQVMSKVHHDKFEEMGGVQAALNPVANIRVGAQILKDYVTRGGSVEAGLKTYVGAAAFETDFGYGSRVLAEYRKLKQVAMGKKVPVTNPKPVAPLVPKAETPAVTPEVAPEAAQPAAQQIAGI
ncbi:transglycosylase SLT domain-containing protein [Pseudoduganella sp. GCM10020061]|uniref:transglycosylase SLT domain-containing protein n=1 Tax=Pseudoduganella sp. GCM10020061 TaxID=3317345 RepID=UPI0036334D39